MIFDAEKQRLKEEVQELRDRNKFLEHRIKELEDVCQNRISYVEINTTKLLARISVLEGKEDAKKC